MLAISVGDWTLMLWKISEKDCNTHNSELSLQGSRDLKYLFTNSHQFFCWGFSLGDFNSLLLLLHCLQEKYTYQIEQMEVIKLQWYRCGTGRNSFILCYFSIIMLCIFYIVFCAFFPTRVAQLVGTSSHAPESHRFNSHSGWCHCN